MFSLEIGISQADGDRGLVENGLADRGGNVLGVGAGEAAAVDQAKVGVLVQGKAQRGAGQHVEVVSAGLEGQRSGSGRGAAVVAQGADVGGLKAYAGYQANMAGELDGVHGVAGGNSLDEVVIVGVDAGTAAEDELAFVALDPAPQLAPVGDGGVFASVTAVIVDGIAEGAVPLRVL